LVAAGFAFISRLDLARMRTRFRIALVGTLLCLAPAFAADGIGIDRAIALAERSLESGDHVKARMLIQRALERDRKSRAGCTTR